MRKMPDIGMDKVTGNLGRNREKSAVAYNRDLLDVLVVILYEPQVSQQSCEVLPTRKRFRVDHDAMQLAILFDVRINFSGDLLEVGRLKRGLRRKHKYSF
jgi:hypothetical protein